MKTIIPAIRQPALAGAALLLLVAAPGRSHAAFLLTLTQVGGNVVVNGTGTLNLTALTLASSAPFSASIAPSSALLVLGSGEGSVYSGATGPTSFGSGNQVFASSSTGSTVGLVGSYYLAVPQGYGTGNSLSSTATFDGASFASLGFTPGTYVYTWGTGVNADSLTITGVVPEPSSGALLRLGVAGLGLTLRRRAARA